MTLGIILFIMSLSLLFLPIWAITSDRGNDRKAFAEINAENEKWIEEQKTLPKYRVLVITKSGEKYYYKSFEPQSSVDSFLGRYSIIKSTSLEMARGLIENCIKFGRYYHPETNLYIPLCEIESFRAIEEKNNG